MDSSTFITIITALAALIGAASPIIVSLIQSNKDKLQKPSGIYVPDTYVLHRPKTQIRWLVVLSFAFLGGAIGFSGAKLASPNQPTQIANITQTIQNASETPKPIFTNPAPSETPIPTFTNLPPTFAVTVTNTPAPLTAQKVETEVTGDSTKSYSVDLRDGEILVGHGTRFQNFNEVAFLITGAGHFDFELKTGLWDKWINVTPDLYDGLIKEQADTLIRYGKSAIVVICDSSGCAQKTSNAPTTMQPYVQNQENFPAYPASPISTPHVSLKDGELLVGTAVRFAARAYGCNTIDTKVNIPYTVFLIRGPIELDIEIDNGGWDKWVNEFVYNNDVAESLLQPKRDEIMKHENYPLVGLVECVIPP